MISACGKPQEHKGDTELSPALAEARHLAQTHCAGCHLFPEPELLDRQTWLFKVLPNMGRRLGMDHHAIFEYAPVPTLIMPGQPQMSQEDWEKIVIYYSKISPESLEKADTSLGKIVRGLKHFDVKTLAPPYLKNPVITLLQIDTTTCSVRVGDGYNHVLYHVSKSGNMLDSLQTGSAPIVLSGNESDFLLTEVGILPPNDNSKGKIIHYKKDEEEWKEKMLIQNLYRPVDMIRGDLNQDGRSDLVVCEYGNNLGKFSWFENKEDGFEEHILAASPGAIKAYLHDFDKNGFNDIIVLFAQGNERMAIYYNLGNGNFREDIIMRFPPVYGSIFFALNDFNNDGYQDILYVNGDNGDYSPVLKNYHGIRILMNQGDNSFVQTLFYPMYGASRAIAHDFDQDGDWDFIATATFPENVEAVYQGIVYLENQGNFNFTTYLIEEVSQHPWNLLDAGDIDQDGDVDVVIGAMDVKYYYGMYESGSPPKNQATVLLLENTIKKAP